MLLTIFRENINKMIIRKVLLDFIISLFKGVFKHIIVLIGLVISICLFWENNLLLFLLLGCSILLFQHLKFYRADEIIIAIVISTGFLIGEIIVVKSGAWSYTNSSLGIPMWLFFAWCHTVIAIHRIANAIGFWHLTCRMMNDKETENES